ncbi:TRAF3-interacting protein [Thraustotheca clavata]|uniref:TRAF3-interacting protein 1 n=1 Tax=Thraustotheca clavata TaxID=74557 RepID=A0A1W0A9T2_9STRA|nr:TRAF3-interacting protein [Thraustotheca clavata]
MNAYPDNTQKLYGYEKTYISDLMGDLNELLKRTQETLQPLIPKPKLADKLLLKPPFRFVHDIFTALIAATGFAKGLYTDYELDSANIKEKHQKLQFLDKMIDCTGQCHGREIDVRSAKIVAGLEPENTNLFLVELAAAASNSSLDWAGAVQKTLATYPALPETIAGNGGAAPVEAKQGAKQEAKRETTPPTKEMAKETPAKVDSEAKEAQDKARAEEKAKERERAKRAKEEREKQEQAENQRRESERTAESKPSSAGSSSRPSSNSKATREDNNASEWAAQIKECNTDIERTKDVIEKIITKPKMSAKLLGKPPFRFLHDIISEMTRTTGFAEGLYSGDELDSNAIKEKQPKIDYLQKIISLASVHLNVEIEVKPAKIVAGLEPEDTNKFLQLLAIAAKAGNSAAAVQRVLSGDITLRPVNSAESKSKRAPRVEQPVPVEAKKEEKKESKADSSSTTVTGGSGPMKPLAVTGMDEDGDLRSQGKENEEDDLKPGTANRTARPTTARRRPPKLKENVKEVGRLVRDDKVAPTVGIMKDGDNADSDDDNNDGDNNNRSSSVITDDGGSHGRLVRNILKDQTADEEANRKSKEDEDNKEDGGIRLGKRRKSFKEKTKGGTSTAAEINELRQAIQKICQATNPVGKCIEYVYEDMESMARELESWKKEYESKCVVLEEEKKKSEDALQPLNLQLVEVEEQIKEQVHKINTLKATITKNEEKTLKLLRLVVTA